MRLTDERVMSRSASGNYLKQMLVSEMEKCYLRGYPSRLSAVAIPQKTMRFSGWLHARSTRRKFLSASLAQKFLTAKTSKKCSRRCAAGMSRPEILAGCGPVCKLLNKSDSFVVVHCRLCPHGDGRIFSPKIRERCRRRFETVRGLAIHLSRVHCLRINWRALA